MEGKVRGLILSSDRQIQTSDEPLAHAPATRGENRRLPGPPAEFFLRVPVRGTVRRESL